MKIKKIIEKTGINPATITRSGLLNLAASKDIGFLAINEIFENSKGNLSEQDRQDARNVVFRKIRGK